jgi:hypothetical protein
MSGRAPVALLPCLPTELLDLALRLKAPTTVIICGSRHEFLSAVYEAVSKTPRPPEVETELIERSEDQRLPPGEQESIDANSATIPVSQSHPLLVPTLGQIARSRHINLVFVPTVSHLRAYLSVSDPLPTQSCTPSKRPYLLVHGLIELHRGTSEWSTQGLGHTLAGLVAVGHRTKSTVIVVERREQTDEEATVTQAQDTASSEEALTQREERRQRKEEGIWHERLPILSGSRQRFRAEAAYAGRSVEVGMVLRRWFKFEKGDWHETKHAECY